MLSSNEVEAVIKKLINENKDDLEALNQKYRIMLNYFSSLNLVNIDDLKKAREIQPLLDVILATNKRAPKLDLVHQMLFGEREAEARRRQEKAEWRDDIMARDEEEKNKYSNSGWDK
jgi:hypothetical protein